MTPKFQNRLVGAIVLVAIGVIILPDVFDGKKEHHQESFQPMPLPDALDEGLLNAELAAPEKVDDVVLPKPPVAETDIEITAKVEQTKEQEDRPTSFQENAWIIRLGTFRDHGNALSLAERLKAKGYPAQVNPRNLREGDLARVEVGPELSMEKISQMRIELEKVTGLKGQLIKFNPISL